MTARSPREVIANAIAAEVGCDWHYELADDVLADLSAAGMTICPPGYVCVPLTTLQILSDKLAALTISHPQLNLLAFVNELDRLISPLPPHGPQGDET